MERQGRGGIRALRNIEVAKQGIERAERWLRGAKVAFSDKRWDDVVYSAQMAVEQSTKAVLFALGVDFPKEHDVSEVFISLAARRELPSDFRALVPFISSVSKELAEQRGLAGYGFEQGITADYFKDYAPQALKMARKVRAACKKLLDRIFKE